ncbi:UDP-N-acetylmuramate dehydrogenase [Hathewaya histolytica]|uniref:UDP-N-acetylenolpyruvoylglucosamine reductase n=1 Tax=Hathewaya histolytica TaxID=1498 RepID=A0A4U9QYR1_HATHI|nr:UDP-N-acetylmuramate dehydrogenase [Hathewaya histolytica]VTQ83855.1 UDP-N-acetylmuramate dehydrogenase [Hathewaya histolytica]
MYQMNGFLSELHKILSDDNIQFEAPMREHTTFKLGGKADILVTPKNYEELVSILKLCKRENVYYYILGKGSNIIVKDGGIRGVVVKLSKLQEVKLIENEAIVAQSGAGLIDVSLYSAKYDLTGLEFASGIPGSVGGAVAMNAGAYGGEICQVLKSVLVIDDDLEIKELKLDDMDFSYRNSVVLKKGYIVLEATFKLKKGNHEEIQEVIHDLTRRRVEKQPLEKASAGSTFKRPEGYFAGKLIQDCGLKGFKIGEAQVSEKHSGFVVNNGKATAEDVLGLIKHVQDTVYKKFNVKLETEVRIIGED